LVESFPYFVELLPSDGRRIRSPATFVPVISSQIMAHPAQIFRNIFLNLKLILQANAKEMQIIVNQDDTYFLHYPLKGNRRGKTFAFIQIRNKYVAFYLHPLEEQPELREYCSPELLQLLQDNGQFQFSKQSASSRLMQELAELIHLATPASRRKTAPALLQRSAL